MTQQVLVSLLAVIVVCPAPAAAIPECDSTSKGYEPLTELVGNYEGYSGGLYSAGVNVPPPPHDSAGRAIAASYTPLDTLGQPDTIDGAWVLLSVGMSNTTQEFSRFIDDLTGDMTLHPRLRIVDGAQGGQSAARIKYDTARYWRVVEHRLAFRGLSPLQVQTIWMKQANAGPTQPFPGHAIILRDDLLDIIRIAQGKYPNLRQLFLSSRIYAGYASTPLNPEPYAYESAFANRWLIESQIDGNDSLNCIADSGEVVAPWLGWGAYLWADGIIARDSDSLRWFCDDFVDDGTHPSPTGREKVSILLQRFFKSSPYTTKWFLRDTVDIDCNCPRQADVAPVASGGDGSVDILDAVAMVDFVFRSGPDLTHDIACPRNRGDIAPAAPCGDGVVNVLDVVFAIDHVFRSGPPPCDPCGP